MAFVKFALLLFNAIFWACGIAVLIGGTLVHISYRSYVHVLGDGMASAPIALIVAGCVIAVMAFFGFCGAVRENYFMTMTFAVLLGVLLVVEIAAGVASYVLRDDAQAFVIDRMRAGMVHYNVTNDDGLPQFDGITRAWDDLQSRVGCCGVESFNDWQNATIYEQTEHVPDSCCRPFADVADMLTDATIAQARTNVDGTLNTTTTVAPTTPTAISVRQFCGRNVRNVDFPPIRREGTIYTNGCVPAVLESVKQSYALFGGVGGAILAIQILTTIAAFTFAEMLRRWERDEREFGYAQNQILLNRMNGQEPRYL